MYYALALLMATDGSFRTKITVAIEIGAANEWMDAIASFGIKNN